MTRYAYDEADNRVAVTDALGHTTRAEYDALDRRTATVSPLGFRATVQYDAAGNAVLSTDADGRVTTRTFDAGGNLLTRTAGGATVAYTYTPAGQLATATDAAGTTGFSYDAGGRLLRRTEPDGRSIAYRYDGAGNRTAIDTPAGATAYTFDARGQTLTVTDPFGGVTGFAYDLAGNRTRTAFADGTVEAQTYNSRDRLRSATTTDAAGGVLLGFAYTTDLSGLRTSVVETGPRPRAVAFAYDQLGRLTAESVTPAGGGSSTTGYGYDAAGNRLSRTGPAGTTVSSHDAADRLLTETTNGVTTAYSYDNSGNTLSRTGGGESAVYGYSADHRLVTAAVTVGGITRTVARRYAGDGLRVATTADGVETRFLIDADRPFAETVEESSRGLVSFAVADAAVLTVRRGGVTGVLHADAVGSTRLVTVGGATASWAERDAFGVTLATGGDPAAYPGFAGRPTDAATGLVDLRARDYDPGTGRFRGADPFPLNPQQPSTVHRFVYAAGNPVNFTDPSGLFTLAEQLVSTGTAGDLVKSYTQNLGKLFLQSVRIAATVIKPSFQLQQIGAALLEHGVPRGEVMSEQGTQLLAAGFKAIESAIREAYKNIAKDILAGIKDKYDAFGSPAPSPNYNSWFQDIQDDLKGRKKKFLELGLHDQVKAVEEFGTQLGEYYTKLDVLLNSPDDRERSKVLEELGGKLLDNIPKL